MSLISIQESRLEEGDYFGVRACFATEMVLVNTLDTPRLPCLHASVQQTINGPQTFTRVIFSVVPKLNQYFFSLSHPLSLSLVPHAAFIPSFWT